MAAPAASAGGPPGLSSSVGESSTASRERRRVALAAKVAVQELSSEVREQFGALFRKLDLVAQSLQTDLMDRISRLETLTVCGSPLEPSVNEVLNEMLLKKVSSDGAERKPRLQGNVSTTASAQRMNWIWIHKLLDARPLLLESGNPCRRSLSSLAMLLAILQLRYNQPAAPKWETWDGPTSMTGFALMLSPLRRLSTR